MVLNGHVSLSVASTTVETLEKGDMFGEMALIDTQNRSATAQAISDVRLVAIDEDRFSFLVQQTPHFALVVMRTLVKRLRSMDETLS
ncbi:MAG: cyclic nucleotide-binding domain-containing protein [Pseudomonadota bacterium]